MTAMSSRRVNYVPAAEAATKGGSWSIVSFIAGILLIALGVKLDIGLIAGAGFVGFVGALMYWNSMFWAKVMKDKHYDVSSNRYNRYL